MAIEVASAYVSIGASTQGLSKQISKDLGKVNVGGAATRTGESIGGKLISGVGKIMKTGALAVGAGVAAGVGTALFKGMDRLKAIDDATAKLTGLGHSTKTVDTIMDNALSSVKGTAFGMGEAATTAAGAVASGIKPGKELERTLKAVADASTIAGTDMGSMGAIFNKVAASNKVQMDVINQLHEAGVPALSLLADQMGVTAEEASKMASAGKIDFATFQSAMESGMGGAALASGETFSGAMDNVMASVGRVGANLLSGLFPQMKDGLGGITEMLAPFEEKAAAVGKILAEWASEHGPAVIDALKGMWEGAQNLFAAIKPVAEFLATALVPYLKDIGKVVMDVIIPAMGGFASGMGDGEGKAGGLAGAVENVSKWLKDAVKWLLENRTLVWTLVAAYAAWKAAQAAMKFVSWAKGIRDISKANIASTKAVVLNTAAGVKNAAAWVASAAATVASKVALVASTVATKAAAAAQWLMNAAMSANPIGLIIAAVAALVAGLIWFFTKTELGQKIVTAVWDAIQVAIKAVVSWFTDTAVPFIKGAWTAITGAFQSGYNTVKSWLQKAWDFIKKVWSYSPLAIIIANWDKITGFIGAIPGKISGFFTNIGGKIADKFSGLKTKVKVYVDKVLGWFKGIPGKISGFFSSLKDKITAPFKAAFNAVAGLWNNTIGKISFDIPSWVPGIGGKGFSVPNISMLADGGIVTRPTLAVVGEGRYDEIVAPLPDYLDMVDQAAAGRGGGLGIHIDQMIVRKESDIRSIAEELHRLMVRDGRVA